MGKMLVGKLMLHGFLLYGLGDSDKWTDICYGGNQSPC